MVGCKCVMVTSYTSTLLPPLSSRRICSAAVKEWFKCLREESVPVLVCLTYGDRLFAEYMKDGNLPDPPVVNRAISDRLEVSQTVDLIQINDLQLC